MCSDRRRPTPSPTASPFRCNGYMRDAQVTSADGARLPLASLPPFLRALLVTDGTVTKILEAYFWEPVQVDTIEQHFEPMKEAMPWLQVAAGETCLIRNARLRGTDSGRDFVEAVSVIRPEWIPDDFRQRLIDRQIGIGVLIRDSGLESYREMLDVGLSADNGNGPLVYRTYRIFICERPGILITEYFPLDLYALSPPVPTGT